VWKTRNYNSVGEIWYFELSDLLPIADPSYDETFREWIWEMEQRFKRFSIVETIGSVVKKVKEVIEK
jgi:hypothetical protein